MIDQIKYYIISIHKKMLWADYEHFILSLNYINKYDMHDYIINVSNVIILILMLKKKNVL